MVKRGAYFGNGSEIRIGDRSQLGEGARIANDTVLGSDVMMGIEVLVLSTVHHVPDRPGIALGAGYDATRPVMLNDECWIGARAIILPGVVIGRGAIVGAGAIVTKDVPDWTVVGGSPARIIRMRT